MLTSEKLKELRKQTEEAMREDNVWTKWNFGYFQNVLELLDELEQLRSDIAFLKQEYGESDDPMTTDAMELKERYRVLMERDELRAQVAVMKSLLEEMLPGVMYYSCLYDKDPEADRWWHCCDWSEMVPRIRQALSDNAGQEILGQLEASEEKYRQAVALIQYQKEQIKRLERIAEIARHIRGCCKTEYNGQIEVCAEEHCYIHDLNKALSALEKGE